MENSKKDIRNLLDKLTPEELNKVVKGEGIQVVLEETKNVGKKIEDILKIDVKMNPLLEKLVTDLTNDPKFLANIDESIKKILKDGTINVSDIPEIIFLIINAYNTVGKIRILKEDMGDFVKLIFEFIVDKYKLLPNNKINEYDAIIISSVKLLLLTPRSLSSFFKCC